MNESQRERQNKKVERAAPVRQKEESMQREDVQNYRDTLRKYNGQWESESVAALSTESVTEDVCPSSLASLQVSSPQTLGPFCSFQHQHASHQPSVLTALLITTLTQCHALHHPSGGSSGRDRQRKSSDLDGVWDVVIRHKPHIASG